MASPIFPLLRLPQKTLKSVLLNMGVMELICTSLLSNKTKHFIREFCIFKASRFSIELAESMHLKISCSGNYLVYSFNNGIMCIEGLQLTQKTVMFPVPQFDAGSWLDHFLHIFKPSNIDILSIYDSFDVESLQLIEDSLNKISISDLTISTTTATNPKLLSAFLPIKILRLMHNGQYNSTQLFALRPVLSKQLVNIFIDRIPLNELLLTCSKTLSLYESQLTDKEINVFLKHWMVGFQKPELGYLYIARNGTAYNPKTILEGIHHESSSCGREFKIFQGPPQLGRIDFHLAHGATASLTFHDNFDAFCIFQN